MVVRKSRDGPTEGSGPSERPAASTRRAPRAEPGTVPRPSQVCLVSPWQQPQKAGNITPTGQMRACGPAREGACSREVRSQWQREDWNPDQPHPEGSAPHFCETPERERLQSRLEPGIPHPPPLLRPWAPPIPVKVSLASSRACPSASSCSRRDSSWASCCCTSNRLLSSASFSKLQRTQSLRP